MCLVNLIPVANFSAMDVGRLREVCATETVFNCNYSVRLLLWLFEMAVLFLPLTFILPVVCRTCQN